MKVVFLLAGANKRFFPFNTSDQKAMTFLYGKPILEHVINALKDKSNLTDFIFVTATHDNSIKEYFNEGQHLGVTITYATLDNPDGQGAASFRSF